MSGERIDVLAVMYGWDVGLTHDLTCLEVEIAAGSVIGYEKELEDRTTWVREAREARAAVAELIEADKEYDSANLALQTLDASDYTSDWECDAAYDALCDRFDAALERRDAALSRVTGGA
jgi:hypothetical protein